MGLFSVGWEEGAFGIDWAGDWVAGLSSRMCGSCLLWRFEWGDRVGVSLEWSFLSESCYGSNFYYC